MEHPSLTTAPCADSRPPVAVIILNWNGRHLLEEYLPSVVANTPESLARVIVADNGSTDDSLSWLATNFPEVEVIAFDTNHGFAGGYNRAIEATRYRYTLLLNSDVRVTPGWLEPLVEWAEAHPELGALQPKIRALRAPSYFEYAGAAGGFIDRHGYPYCRGRIFDVVEEDNGQYDTPREVFWATGAAMLVDTKAYLAAGGLDEAFFAHMEEIDLCWRLLLMGRKNYVVPASTVYHLGGASLDAANPRKTYLNFRNNLLMLHKNLPRRDRGRQLFVRRLLDTLAWGKFMATMKWGHAAAILSAHKDYRKMSGNYDTDPATNLLAGTPDILTSFYLKGIKTYSNLDRNSSK